MNLNAGARIALVAEELSDRPDEGALRTLERLARFLNERFTLQLFHSRGTAPPGLRAERLPFTRAGITPALWRALRTGPFDLVLYAPSASLTINALWRARLIRMASRRPVVVVGLQRRSLGPWSRRLAGVLAPGVVGVTSRESAREFEGSGLDVLTLALGVDLERFRPVDPVERDGIRASLGWAATDTVILHVGHLRARRGLAALAGLASRDDRRVVLVASVSETGEERLAKELLDQGVEVHHEFVPDIERFYQAADAYIFPVRDGASAIDFPLSVLEALACGLPVLSTRYGALPDHFDGQDGLRFLGPDEDLESGVEALLARESDPRRLVEGFGWDDTFESWLRQIEAVLP